MAAPIPSLEDREKQSVALSSLLAAVGLTAFKIVVGLATGSLGILAEAAHSGLDLIAAGMTLVAVRISSRPPDRSHLYGHGKLENLSALFETLLLLLTCGWVAWEASHRLIAQRTGVQVTVWSFAVMLISIATDISRSRVLSHTAKKYHSQALEADALHFQTDIWSSTVVIFGLIAVLAADRLPAAGWLRQGDAVAALGVSALVVWVSVRLGQRSIDALMDHAPIGMEGRIAELVAAVPGVLDCHNLRVRYSGPQLFIDCHVLVDGAQTLTQAHRLTDRIEEEIQALVPGADVTVHPEPFEGEQPRPQ
ncbi:MAG TPA: cation diffusion facilitator family transporter [Acetobacteraceae bacterium]|nr:cation diffusion facilitator family transporter [Acetobacteraceae bacterium]